MDQAKKNYQPQAKIIKTEVEDDGIEIADSQTNNVNQQYIKEFNEDLLAKYPEEYTSYKEDLKREMQPEIDAYYQKRSQESIDELEAYYERELRMAKNAIIMACEENLQDELKKIMTKEKLTIEQRKEEERKKEYENIEREIIRAKEQGKRVCLQCGANDVNKGCRCHQAFYCNENCQQRHSQIHQQYCLATK